MILSRIGIGGLRTGVTKDDKERSGREVEETRERKRRRTSAQGLSLYKSQDRVGSTYLTNLKAADVPYYIHVGTLSSVQRSLRAERRSESRAYR